VQNHRRQCNISSALRTLAAVLFSALLPCCSVAPPTSGISSPNTIEPCIWAAVTTSSEYYDFVADSFLNDTCLSISVACIGTPMPLIQSVLLDGQAVTMHAPFDMYIGVMKGYARVVDLYSTKTLKVVTDRGTASARCAVPAVPPWVVTPAYGVQLTRGNDQLFTLDGACEYYHFLFTGQSSSPYGLSPLVILDTIATSASFVLPGRFTDSIQGNGLTVAVKGYNGELPFLKGALANMTGSAYGFLFATNTFNNSWDSPAIFTLSPANVP
jgi:hypothetical protein